MKKLIIALLLVLLLLVPVACARPQSVPSERPAPMPAPAPALVPPPVIIAPPAPMPAPMPPREGGAYKDGALPSIEEARMIVRTGDILLVVADVVDARDEIAQLAVRLGGYVVSSWISGEEEEMRGGISIRVPDDKFEPALAELRNLAVRVTSESTGSQDVTEEYIDLQSRLKNAEATEAQYLALLEKAEEVEDILRIYDSLSRVRNEIEQIKGRMQYLERTSSMSLISVRLEPAKLDAKFTADKTRVKEGQELQFTGQIAGGFVPYSYEWDFGDGSTSTSKAPTHAYKTAGSYTVSLRVTDDRGSTDTETRSEYIIVLPGWSTVEVFKSAVRGIVIFGQWLGTVAIWLLIFSPVWGAIIGVIYWRLRRKKRKAVS